MNYSQYLKEKIINLYSTRQKIGKTLKSNFDFLDNHFNQDTLIKPNIFSVSEILQYIITDFESNLKLKNLIGLDFLNSLIDARRTSKNFLIQEPLTTPQIIDIQKQELETKYTEIANQYGLKEFYYSLNPNLSPNENYDKAILLLNKTCIELEKLKSNLNIEDSFKIGNGILSIQVNWQEDPRNNGYYNYCSNTICLKDESSTFPLVHEYIHFIDKTTTCLLLTGKTSQQLYEEKIFSQKELFHNFDMSVFSKIEFNKDNFPWIDIIQLYILFKYEIN